VVRTDGRLIACTAPGLQSASAENGAVRVQIVPPANDLPALYVLIAGVRSPVAVRLNGAELPKVDDMDALIWQLNTPHSGWAQHELGMIVRLVNPSAATLEIVD
jgi:hypothetical protein